MLTPEREAEIRKVNQENGPSIICNELLAEIVRLRSESETLSEKLVIACRVLEYLECHGVDDLPELMAFHAKKALAKIRGESEHDT